jgi:hypothetical protein
VGFENIEKLSEPGRVSRPCRAGDKLAVGDSFGDFKWDEGTSSQFYLRCAGGICVDALACKDTGSGEELRAMAESRDGFSRAVEVTNDVENTRVEAEIFGSAAAGYDKGVIVFGLDFVKGGVKNEVVAWLFGVGLIAFEVVDGGANTVAGFFIRADCMDGMADHLERLEGNHDLVVFHEVANDHEKLCRLEGRAMGGH